MYTLESLKHGLDNPHKILQEVNRLYHRRLRTWTYNRDGIDIFARDWDHLLILDACRYDMFAEQSSLPGELEPVQSRASATKEFLKANFDGRELLDTVYVTGSPMLHRHRSKIKTQLHDVINVWNEDGWDEQYRTVLPKTMTEAAIEAKERYPNKRLLVHYLQPHYPFLGPTGQEHFDLGRLDFEWYKLLSGELNVSDAVVKRAFKENLDVVLPEVERLFDEFSGKTVVSADHGQVIGKRGLPIPIREYGHPQGIYSEELVTVPWLTYESGDRPEIIAENSGESATTDHDEEAARQRLEHLGYVN
ncbi:hypothetical protein [Haloarcula japonica]|uniref:Sulfatase n=1 Tax=Haloarcula japonica (strain ATCC 49778 / DSM 6131 / JCM 7785 / NBRC 101032 / NCIMB 13157 / TR-1) TaxID=1227453 RepID=M0L0T4_HALJT|nr:hypothetical protein C444_20591 [Haloarcula japonica DSM 6131]